MNVLVSDSWSLGWVIGGPAAIVVLIVILGLAAWFLRLGVEDSSERGFFLGLGAIFGVIGALLLAFFLTPWGLYPTGGSDYHKYKVKSGVVSTLGKRLLPDGEHSMEEKIVVRFKGSNQEYGVTDTRAAIVKEGDTLVIKCKKAYDFGSIPGYDCKFVSSTPAGGAK